MARAHAVKTKTSISMAIRDLLRRATYSHLPPAPNHQQEPAFYIDPVTLLPVVRANAGKITEEAMQNAIDDEDLRHLERMELGNQEISTATSR